MTDPRAAGARRRLAGRLGAMALAGLAVTGLAGCAGPTARDQALFHMFWVAPSNLEARTVLPDGLGMQSRPMLVMTLVVGGPDVTARQGNFQLVPKPRTATAATPAFALARGDYGRFRAFQDRVVASIGPAASVSVRLDIAYCADLSTPPATTAPMAEVIDAATNTVIMERPASATARSLQPTLPPCS